MIPRGRLDIKYRDIFAGIYYCCSAVKTYHMQFAWPNSLCCLSVRSGFDLVLQALKLPAGSEVLITDINIPGMFEIIRAHKLVAVPLAVNKHTLSITIDNFQANINSSTKAVIFTHLFGSISEISPLVEIAKQKGLFIIEDCAQAFTGSYTGNKSSDVIMFSFGMIKTNTALGGAILIIKNDQHYKNVLALQKSYPLQKREVFIKKLIIALVIKFLCTKFTYSTFYRLLKFRGKDPDDILSGFTRGFPTEGDLFGRIRVKPSLPLFLLIERRINKFRRDSIDFRSNYGMEILRKIPETMKIGGTNKYHSFWVLPVEAQNPDKLIKVLRSNGFDATSKASSMIKLSTTLEIECHCDELKLDKLVYLPLYPDMKLKDQLRLIKVINNV